MIRGRHEVRRSNNRRRVGRLDSGHPPHGRPKALCAAIGGGAGLSRPRQPAGAGEVRVHHIGGHHSQRPRLEFRGTSNRGCRTHARAAGQDNRGVQRRQRPDISEGRPGGLRRLGLYWERPVELRENSALLPETGNRRRLPRRLSRHRWPYHNAALQATRVASRPGGVQRGMPGLRASQRARTTTVRTPQVLDRCP